MKEKIETKVFRLQKKKCLKIKSFSPAEEKVLENQKFFVYKRKTSDFGRAFLGEKKN